MAIPARFAHANVVARDWQRLAGFYEEVFGCTRLVPERDLCGPSFEGATGKSGAHARGTHRRRPGALRPATWIGGGEQMSEKEVAR